MMLKKKFTPAFFVLAGILVVFVLTLPAPPCAQSAGLRYGTWELDGFVRNNSGVWLESFDYTFDNDPLATFRNWFRLNLNGAFTRDLRLKAEVLAIWEPDYAREEEAFDADKRITANYYNYLDFRELRLDWRISSGHYLRVGRQIVNWGESISARVGDVINPVDSRWELGFTNLEDTRMPIWMVRGLHKFRSLRTSLDWIFSPYLQTDRYRVNRTPSNIGHFFVDGNFIPGPRFAGYHETLEHQEDYYNAPTFVFDPTIAPVALPISVVPGLPVIGAPFGRTFYTALPADFFYPGSPAGNYLTGAPNVLETDYPDSSLEDARWGLKTSSTIMGWQAGFYFWDANELSPVFEIERSFLLPTGLTVYDIRAKYPRQQVYGLYTNKNFDFGVVRMDAAYRPNREYNTLDRTVPSGIVEKDFLQVQLGFNRDMMIRKINPNQAFSFIFEYVLEYFLEDTDKAAVPSYFIEYPRDLHTLFFSGSTNYNFGKYTYALTAIYNSEECGLVQPSITYNPDWMNRKWTFKLQYSALFGSDYSYPYGLAKEKDMIVLTTQYSFPQ
ncbi:MAG: DUF1302 family protein [Desulfobacterales bacterium]